MKTKRQIRDHERYMLNHDERLLRQREYYQAHREEILYKRKTGTDRYIKNKGYE